MPDDSFTALKVSIAEFGVELRNVAHDVKGALMEMKNFVSKREVDQIKADLQDRIESKQQAADDRLAAVEAAHDARLAAIEGPIRWVVRIIVGAIVVALLGLVVTSRAKVGM